MDSLTLKHWQHLQPALDAIMDAHARAIVAYHRHACHGGCGDYLMCSKDADHCPPPDWTCDDCLTRQMDEYYQQSQEANRADHR